MDGYKDTVRLLLQHKAHVNAHNRKGWTALMHAAHIGATSTVELLIEHGADIQTQVSQN